MFRKSEENFYSGVEVFFHENRRMCYLYVQIISIEKYIFEILFNSIHKLLPTSNTTDRITIFFGNNIESDLKT